MILIILEFPGKIIAKITANAAAVYNHFHTLKLFTKNKTIENTLQGSFSINDKKIIKNNYKYPDKINRKKFIRNFLDYIQNKRCKLILTHKEQFDLMSVCFAAEKSLKNKKKIKIKYL